MTDLATAQKPDYTRSASLFIRLILTVSIYLPAFFLTGYVYMKGYSVLSSGSDITRVLIEQGILSSWRSYRNDLYMFYAVAISATVIALTLSRKEPRPAWSRILSTIPSTFIIGMLLVTFSYALGAYLLEVTVVKPDVVTGSFNLLQKFLGQ